MTTILELEPSANPLLSCIRPFIHEDTLGERLVSWPLLTSGIEKLSKQERLDLLYRMHEEMFEPTSISLELGTRIFRILSRGYLKRDPRDVRVKRLSILIAQQAGKLLQDLPWLPSYAKCMTVSGITGVGKTFEVSRILSLIPQVIEHETSVEAGWLCMKQIVWLYVAMSHDGTLGGLLLQILCAIDAVSVTTYAEDRSLKRMSNEKLAVHVGIILSNHHVGLLVIDEIQERNFSAHERGALAATFFLRLLNFGIPMLLMGNPYGLNALNSFAQDVRRSGSGGTIEIDPMGADDPDWQYSFAPAILRYNVMDEPTPVQEINGSILHQYSGGLRDYACRNWSASQRLALDLGCRSVTQEHMRQVFLGPDFSGRDRDIIIGFRDRDPTYLTGFEDIPWQRYARIWGASSSKKHRVSESTTPDDTKCGNAPMEKSASQKDHQTLKRNRTRKGNNKRRQDETKAELDPCDLRHSGLKEVLISGFEALRDAQTGT